MNAGVNSDAMHRIVAVPLMIQDKGQVGLGIMNDWSSS